MVKRVLAVAALVPTVLAAQQGQAIPGALPPVIKTGGSSNIHLLAHIPLGGFFRVMDDELEQEPGRPYAYVSQSHDRPGFTIISLKDLNNIHVLYNWRIENPELHQGLGGMDGKYFKIKGKYYYEQSLQFQQGTPDADLGAVIADVTGLPDTSKIKIVARLRDPDHPGGFHNTFVYKHSDGRVLLFNTVNAPEAEVWDLEKVLASPNDPQAGLIGHVPVPEGAVASNNPRMGRYGYHDFYLAYDPATHQDKFYGAGRGGYYVYDVTDVTQPKLLTSITGTAGVVNGHTFTPTPDGKYAITETEYQYAPLRIFDLQPGLDGKVQAITKPIGAWTADWRDLSHNHEIRWPYVFVSAYEDGLQVFNMIDPANPVTVGWYYTCQCQHETGFGGIPAWNGTSVENGAFGIDIRNYDGLIEISDSNTGVPNISSVQDYDHGPPGSGGPKKMAQAPTQ
jgi:hypothetical protein